jgi:hypothetical protein
VLSHRENRAVFNLDPFAFRRLFSCRSGLILWTSYRHLGEATLRPSWNMTPALHEIFGTNLPNSVASVARNCARPSLPWSITIVKWFCPTLSRFSDAWQEKLAECSANYLHRRQALAW